MKIVRVDKHGGGEPREQKDGCSTSRPIRWFKERKIGGVLCLIGGAEKCKFLEVIPSLYRGGSWVLQIEQETDGRIDKMGRLMYSLVRYDVEIFLNARYVARPSVKSPLSANIERRRCASLLQERGKTVGKKNERRRA